MGRDSADNKITTDDLIYAWEMHCINATGKVLDMNLLELKEGHIIIGYECELDDDPINCRSGETARRISMHYPYAPENVLWS